MKIDSDLKAMSPAQLRQEIMRYRRAFASELNHTGNHRCWATLEEARTGKKINPIQIPESQFLGNCRRYFLRNTSFLRKKFPCPRCHNSMSISESCISCGYRERMEKENG